MPGDPNTIPSLAIVIRNLEARPARNCAVAVVRRASLRYAYRPVEGVLRDTDQSDEQGQNTVIAGGAGYIGSHIVVKLCQSGYTPVIVDNFYNSSASVTGRLEMLAGTGIEIAEMDIRDASGLAALFQRTQPSAVIHCAGLKAVGESVSHPVMYYEQNIGGSLNLLKQMDAAGCRQIVFSSSATVYGEAGEVLSRETLSLTGPTNPYGSRPSCSLKISSATGALPERAGLRRCSGISTRLARMSPG